uniref:Uncharacterized protein n=1 Tax=Oryza sativa subsp. japonica TaxID=39947 RepID=Q2R359_ORYSJ|nr:hypothetical protein LOC_Os11g33040 [Oryza sativa Japonica Group]
MKGTMQGVDCLPRVPHSWSMVGKGLTGDKVAVRTGFVPERIGDQSASNTETILIWFRLVTTMFKMPPVRLKVETLVSASLEKRQPALLLPTWPWWWMMLLQLQQPLLTTSGLDAATNCARAVPSFDRDRPNFLSTSKKHNHELQLINWSTPPALPTDRVIVDY